MARDTTRHERAFLPEALGHDLTSDDLDELWDAIQNGRQGTVMAAWLKDKPHQILTRLILRLTRAEARPDQVQGFMIPEVTADLCTILAAWEALGVSRMDLEAMVGRPVAEWSPAAVKAHSVALQKVHTDILRR